MSKKNTKKKIVVSSYSGFCFGVKRALGIAEKALKSGRAIYSLGPIIHNPQVVDAFSKKGLRITRDISKLKPKKGLSVLVPSHGVNPSLLKKKQFAYINTTCPLVERVQKIVKDLKKKGYFIIIIGDKKHPEVRGLSGIAGKNSCVVKNKNEVKVLKLKSKKVALISQTTASVSSFVEVLAEIGKKGLVELVSFNTVCKNTRDRQKEARRIARRVDAMLVIGGKESANTSKLTAACKDVNKNTCHVECKDDLNAKFLKNKKSIGIATGASTPTHAIDEVIEKIRRFDN